VCITLNTPNATFKYIFGSVVKLSIVRGRTIINWSSNSHVAA
jgi:hypothetical protein